MCFHFRASSLSLLSWRLAGAAVPECLVCASPHLHLGQSSGCWIRDELAVRGALSLALKSCWAAICLRVEADEPCCLQSYRRRLWLGRIVHLRQLLQKNWINNTFPSLRHAFAVSFSWAELNLPQVSQLPCWVWPQAGYTDIIWYLWRHNFPSLNDSVVVGARCESTEGEKQRLAQFLLLILLQLSSVVL